MKFLSSAATLATVASAAANADPQTVIAIPAATQYVAPHHQVYTVTHPQPSATVMRTPAHTSQMAVSGVPLTHLTYNTVQTPMVPVVQQQVVPVVQQQIVPVAVQQHSVVQPVVQLRLVATSNNEQKRLQEQQQQYSSAEHKSQVVVEHPKQSVGQKSSDVEVGAVNEVSQQFHKQDDFGNYAYGYANNNSEKQEVGNTQSGQVKGHYTYVDGNGMNRRVDYVADNNGFRASGKGINEHRIKREAEAEAEAAPKVMTRMTSVMTSAGDLDNTGVQMKTYMTNEDSADKAEDHGSKKMVLATMDNVNGLGEMEVRNMNIIRTPNSMVYRTDMQRPVDMVYMSMDPTSRGTLITGRMSTNDLLKASDMDMYRMNEMEQKRMNVDLMGRNNLMNTMGMRRNNMDLIMGQQQPMMRTTNLYDLLRSQQQQQGLYDGHFMGRTNVYTTNPVELMRMGAKPEMEVRRFQMVPNMSYRFDF